MVDLTPLSSRITGRVYFPDDSGYSSEVTGFNLAVAHHPAAAVAAESANDVLEAVRFARETGLHAYAHATGHGAHHPIEGGILINTTRLAGLVVDPDTRIATVQAGLRWGAVIEAAAEHGLAPVGGSSSTVGVIGYLTGGGLGPLARSHGFSSDYVESFTVVTGTGAMVMATRELHPDLFWALRGGKGGFGIVIEAQIRLVELTELYGGSILFDVEHAQRVLTGWIEWTATAPQSVTTSVALVRFPPFEAVPAHLRGRHLLALRFAYPGHAAQGHALAAPLRDLAPVFADMLGEMRAADIATIHNDPVDPTPSWGRGGLLAPLDGAFVAALLDLVGAGTQLPFLGIELRHLGAATRVDVPEGSAVGGREGAFTYNVLGVPDPSLFDSILPAAWGQLATAIHPWIAPETTINWVDDPSDPAQFDAAWSGETRARLAQVRRHYNVEGVLPFGPEAAPAV